MTKEYKINIGIELEGCDIYNHIKEHMIHSSGEPTLLLGCIEVDGDEDKHNYILSEIDIALRYYMELEDEPEVISLSYRNYVNYDFLVYDIYSNKLQCLINTLSKFPNSKFNSPNIVLCILNDEYYFDESIPKPKVKILGYRVYEE